MVKLSSIDFPIYISSLRSVRRIVPPFACFLLFLLAYNGFNILLTRVPFPAEAPPAPSGFSTSSESGKLQFSVMYAVKEDSPHVVSKTQLPIVEETNILLPKIETLFQPMNNSVTRKLKRVKKKKHSFKTPLFGARPERFLARVEEFLGEGSSDSSCKLRFFMTWISSFKSFGSREFFTIQSLFKSHPDGCLILISKSMDSRRGNLFLSPLVDKGFRVIAISPDYYWLFEDTPAEIWFNKLRNGKVDPGEVPLGQNISNLLRLALLYKFGGIYVDTDVIVLKSFSQLRNVIGAQTTDPYTKEWSRLNNAVLIFDKEHPLIYKFIQEFALTFDGNKWGHNGPYMASRVVNRLRERPGYNFTVLQPPAFYPVYWDKIEKLFEAPADEKHSKWRVEKLRQIYSDSYSVHLWNRQSKGLKVEDGSIIAHIVSDYCVFCNSTSAL